MPSKVEQRVYSGVLDFQDGEWRQKKTKRGLVIRFPWVDRYEGRTVVPRPEELGRFTIAGAGVDRWGKGL